MGGTKMKMTGLFATAALVLAGCSASSGDEDVPVQEAPVEQEEEETTPEPEPEPTTEKPEPKPEPTLDEEFEFDDAQITELAIQMTWDDMSFIEQEEICDGIATFGMEFALDAFKEGAGNDTTMDMQVVEQFFRGKCGL